MSSEKFSSNEVEKVLRMKGDSFEVVELPKFADISVALDQREAFLDLYEAELRMNPDLTERPDEWFDTNLRSYVEEGVEEPQDVLCFFDLHKRESRIMTELDKRKSPDEESPFPSGVGNNIASFLYRVSPEKVAKAFAIEAEDGELHTEVLNALRDSRVLKMLQASYDISSTKELLGVTGGAFEERLKQQLLQPQMLSHLQYLEDIGSGRESRRVWMREVASAATGISEDKIDAYIFSASVRFDIANHLADVIEKINHFGLERIEALTAATGIKGLEGYSIAQLERMERFATDPKLLAEEMKKRDVNVVMINRTGDHNGVMRNVAEYTDDVDSNSRTLFFEIDSASDIFRHFSKMKKQNILPAALILAAHGSEGRIIISDESNPENVSYDAIAMHDRDYSRYLNETKPVEGARRLAIDNMAGVARLVDEYMQGSKGADDAEEQAGRKKIIFISCEAATDTELKTANAKLEEEVVGTESVVSQLAKDLKESGVVSTVDVYGAPASIQIERTEHGIAYTGSKDGEDELYTDNEGNLKRPQLHAVKISLAGGQISQQNVAEIALRK